MDPKITYIKYLAAQEKKKAAKNKTAAKKKAAVKKKANQGNLKAVRIDSPLKPKMKEVGGGTAGGGRTTKKRAEQLRNATPKLKTRKKKK